MKWFVTISIGLLLLAIIAIQRFGVEVPTGETPVSVTASNTGQQMDRISDSQNSSAVVSAAPIAHIINADAIQSGATDPLPAVSVASKARCQKLDVVSGHGTEAATYDRFSEQGAQANEADGEKPSTLDKKACYHTASVLKKAWEILDVTPTQAVRYSTDTGFGGAVIRDMLLPELCTGDQPFDPPLDASFELVAFTDKSTVKVLLGKYWVSDGTVWTQLTEAQYSKIARWMVMRQHEDGNMSRKEFDERVESKWFNRKAAQDMEIKRREAELRRAQQGFSMDCVD